MKRRTFLAGVGAVAAAPSLSAPALAQSSRARTLILNPTTGLLVLDPLFSPINPTVFHGYNVFDTLYAVDSQFRPHPQMAEGHTVSNDKLTWNITLRPGLKFHDGQPVLARDCVASIKRWGLRDSYGQSLLSYTDEVSAPNDNTIRFRLKKPFSLLPDALAHPVGSPCMIMPERIIASADPAKPVTEMVGSGPLRWVASEFIPGQRAVYEKNAAYVPRQEQPDATSGGKVVNFDRFEWQFIPDASTAGAALQTGEIDWWEVIHFDSLPLLKKSRDITIATVDGGQKNFLRFNCGIKPFDNPALRRVVAAALTPADFAAALVGDDLHLQETCFAMYACGLPGVEQLGTSLMSDAPKDYKLLADSARKAGYSGEKVVLLSSVDAVTVAPMAPVLADVLTKIGMQVDLQEVELNTLIARRNSQAPVEQGGWSMFINMISTPLHASPLTANFERGLGLKGFPGNFKDDVEEGLIVKWIDAASGEDRTAALNAVHRRLWEMVPVVPLCTYKPQTAFRSDLTGHIPFIIPMPWNIRRT